MKDKEYVDSPEKYMVSLLETISQNDPQLVRQIQRDLIEQWDIMKELEKMSVSFLKMFHIRIIEAFKNKALNLRNEQDWPGLIAHCKHWLEIEQGNIFALYNIASGHREMEHYHEAIQAYREVLDRDPDHCVAWSDLGEIYMLMGHYEESVKAYQEVLNLNPDDVITWHHLSQVYEKLGHKEKTTNARRQVESIIDDEAATWFNAGVKWVLTGNIGAAYAAFEELRQRDQTRAHKLLDKINNEWK